MEGTDWSRYAVAGRSDTTAATANHCIGSLWNPHATMDIFVIQVTWSQLSGLRANACRISTKGTPGSTITPGIDNDFERLIAPISGAVLDLAAFSVQPTRAAPEVWEFLPTAASTTPLHEIYLGDDGIRVPAGTGLGVFTGTATAAQADISFIWDE